ncbi:MAG: insulinase family protein [Bacillus subtilis]|nr:insulinase family protein [Bacillus subtilis]
MNACLRKINSKSTSSETPRPESWNGCSNPSSRFATRFLHPQWLDKEGSKRQQPQTIVETAPIKQAKINIGYRANTWYDDPDVIAMFVFNAMFGDSEQSALFQTVREKHHLAYYVQSSYHHNKGFLSVMAGVEPAMADKAIEAIAVELKKLQDGDFSNADLDLAKTYLAEQQRRGLDSPASLINAISIIATNLDAITTSRCFKICFKTFPGPMLCARPPRFGSTPSTC